MQKLMKNFYLILIASLAIVPMACDVSDADLDTYAAIEKIELTAAVTAADETTAKIIGTITLGYTSVEFVNLQIFANDQLQFESTFLADALVLNVDQTIKLPSEGLNDLNVIATYFSQTSSQNLQVTVAEGIGAFTLTPAATSVNIYEVSVSGTATVGYMSANSAKLEIFVNGSLSNAQSFDVSTSTAITIAATTIPLPLVGNNDVTATLTYNGNVLTQQSTVAVAILPTTVAWPTWTEAANQAGDVTVTVGDAGYTIDSVSYNVNGGAWLNAPLNTGTAYTLALANLALGANDIVVKVDTSNLGHAANQFFTNTATLTYTATTVAWPAWTNAGTQPGDVTVTLGNTTNYTIDAVSYSVDGVQWLNAPLNTGTDYTLSLVNLDIGDNNLIVSVESSNGGIVHNELFYDIATLTFDCALVNRIFGNEPLTDNANPEIMMLGGYYGNPNNHDVSFSIDWQADTDGNVGCGGAIENFQSIGIVYAYGRDMVNVGFDPNPRNANDNRIDKIGDCGTPYPYNLSIYFDGALVACGVINNFGTLMRW